MTFVATGICRQQPQLHDLFIGLTVAAFARFTSAEGKMGAHFRQPQHKRAKYGPSDTAFET